MLMLASCSDTDFGLWTPDQKQVTKEKLPSRIMSAAWSSDGAMLALGMINGQVSIRNQQAEEIAKFERKAPVWCLAFLPDMAPPKAAAGPPGTNGGNMTAGNAQPSNPSDTNDVLAVGCWDKTYSLYRVGQGSCKQQTEKNLKYFPLSMTYASNSATKSSYVVITGSNKKTTLYSKEGARLTDIITRDSWLWSGDCNGESEMIILGSSNGAIECVKMNFEAVHALYRDRYAYRENLTEVIVHHLVTDKKVRIKCKDLIQNLSLYKNKLAVQLSDRVCIYESNVDDTVDMHFKLRKEKIMIKDSREGEGTNNATNLMAVTSNNLVLCVGHMVELYAFDGVRLRVWTMDSRVNCIRVDGGPDGREGLLVGLQGGSVHKIYIDNPFPLEVTKRPAPIVQLDINIYRTVLTVVDSSNTLHVIDLRTQEVLYSAPNVLSACFNTEVEDLICLTSVDMTISVLSGISISNLSTDGAAPKTVGKLSTPELQEQHINGSALGFRGQKIFCLHRGGIVGVDVPQGMNMQRALENNNYQKAYKIACLGATEADWKLLAMKAMRSNQLGIAKNAFGRLKDTKFLSLIDSIARIGPSQAQPAAASKSESSSEPSGRRIRLMDNAAKPVANAAAAAPTATTALDANWLAELMAYEGHHQEAAKVYARAGKLDEAIRLFTDLRRWEDAKMFARNAGQTDVSHLTVQQAKWLQEINDWKGSSELFVSMGQYYNAAKIIGDNEDVGWQDAMLEVVRSCPPENVETLEYCGEKFCSLENTQYACETYTKLKDISKLMALYAKRQMWNEAAKLADENEGKFDVTIFLSYAEWLVSQDRYEEAMKAFRKSKRHDLARKLLEELTNNAVAESRFKDAAYYYWLLSKESETDDSNDDAEKERALLLHEYEHKADLYFAYANVHSFVTDPFTSQQPEMLFQVSRFIINSLGSAEVTPFGISKASTLYTLARQAMILGCFKLARHAYDRLSKLQIPPRKVDEVEVDMLLVQAKPVRDAPDHLPVCYRCSSTNPLLNPFTNKLARGDVCTNCGHPFVRSFINFDILPLVEFVPEPSISDEEAIDLIRQPPTTQFMSSKGSSKPSKKRGGGGGGWRETKDGEADTLTFDDGGGADEEDAVHEALGVNLGEKDLFTRCLNLTLEKQV